MWGLQLAAPQRALLSIVLLELAGAAEGEGQSAPSQLQLRWRRRQLGRTARPAHEAGQAFPQPAPRALLPAS
ncbi:hypothetical protein CHLRE_04g225176v5 [Chlamydomonas reinhardtii]|uniref:Uncharacterized protein n=1 Tax=Chlamydomonas reinhardtii TaxID=3055 RepID=A0A2K3DUL2_CHLRE|nr:uncharacterized protein CHLRE_04g225176v5 [Chlamydomonas reinhardtii]PNW84205.1 hypothetical protein CHLRE_04g225176v5 [Chlamydomonas reinhardtii]